MNTNKTIKPKSERLGWESLSDKQPIRLNTIIGTGERVIRDNVVNPKSGYHERLMIP
jgi:hypothetical protein